jgi:hypothetical protein
VRLTGRLRRLEGNARERGLLPEPGCPACRDRRGLTVFVRSRVGADGAVLWEEEGPAACAACGEVPEDVTEIVEQVVLDRGGARAFMQAR